MNKYLKYLLKALGLILCILLLIYVGIFIYVSVNKQSIIRDVTAAISKKLKGKVEIRNGSLDFIQNFPKVAVSLDSVTVKDTLFDEHKQPFFQARKVYLRISVLNLLQKKEPLTGLTIEKGSLYLFRDSTGYTNNYLLKVTGNETKPDRSEEKEISLKDIVLKDFQFTLKDVNKDKLIKFDFQALSCDVKDKGKVVELAIKQKVFIQQLGFNLEKGVYLKEKMVQGKFTLFFNKKEKKLILDNLPLDIAGHRFKFDGYFNLGEAPTFRLAIETKNIQQDLALSFLTDRISKSISRFKVEKPIDVNSVLEGPLTPGEPLIHVNFTVRDNNIQTPSVNFINANFVGHYTNELVAGQPRNDDNSRIEFHQFKGVWEGIELQSKNIYVDNLTNPVLRCDIKSSFDLMSLNNLLGSNAIDLTGGNGKLDISYKGPLMDNTNITPELNGTLQLEKGLLLYVPRNVQLSNCNGSIFFSGTDVSVLNLYAEAGENKITMNGKATKLLTLIKADPSKVQLDWNIYSPALNLRAFAGMLKSRSKKTSGSQKAKMGKITSQLDNMLDQSNVKINLKTDKLSYNRFTASDVHANISLTAENWTLNDASLRHAGGNMQIKGSVNGTGNDRQIVAIKALVNNIDVTKMMYAFNNFGQNGIESDNIKGNLSATADMKMQLVQNKGDIDVKNMNGVVDFFIDKGELLNYEPLKKLQGIFKSRDFDHIYFADMKDKLEINEGEIKINPLVIRSTALSIYVEGLYSMKGNTNISIRVPLNNILKSPEDYDKLVNGESKRKAGMSVYLRGTPGADGNIKFKYDPFSKFRKKDSKNEEKIPG